MRTPPPEPLNSKVNHTSSSQNYVRSIHAHSLRSIAKSTFPGPNYIDLANWLLLEADYAPSAASDSHPPAFFYNLGADSTESLRGLSASSPEEVICQSCPAEGLGQLLFLRGFLTPAWVSAIGSHFWIDPEYLQRHLDFFADSIHRSYHSLPSLPSTTNNIIRICVNTIFLQDHPLSAGRESLQQRRQEQVEQLCTYRRQLRTRARCGDSIVREHSTLDHHYSMIEQWVSVCIVPHGHGWVGKSYVSEESGRY